MSDYIPFPPVETETLPDNFHVISRVGLGNVTTFSFSEDEDDVYYLIYHHSDGLHYRYVAYILPSVESALQLGGNGNRPPSCFILFRQGIQTGVRSLGLRIDRASLSRVIKNIWDDLKSADHELIDHLKKVWSQALIRFNRTNFTIRFAPYPVLRTPAVGNPSRPYERLVSDEFEEQIVRELFCGD
ncbi:15756_t:CDS:1 [Acaulospora morrowiae]|uniref:15756_t:CDS:1 n=1 Tax=Acaulospora morrowiae TaxID=94023 RepID=A0A9N8YQA4_9GLOM|nr:15756_t:CDS:1 [Acaulospora morrowiae]